MPVAGLLGWKSCHAVKVAPEFAGGDERRLLTAAKPGTSGMAVCRVASVPQFSVPHEGVCVGKGDMVGRWELFHLALPLQPRRHEIKPSVTGSIWKGVKGACFFKALAASAPVFPEHGWCSPATSAGSAKTVSPACPESAGGSVPAGRTASRWPGGAGHWWLLLQRKKRQ